MKINITLRNYNKLTFAAIMTRIASKLNEFTTTDFFSYHGGGKINFKSFANHNYAKLFALIQLFILSNRWDTTYIAFYGEISYICINSLDEAKKLLSFLEELYTDFEEVEISIN